MFARFVPDSVVRRLITGDDKASRLALGRGFEVLSHGELLGSRRLIEGWAFLIKKGLLQLRQILCYCCVIYQACTGIRLGRARFLQSGWLVHPYCSIRSRHGAFCTKCKAPIDGCGQHPKGSKATPNLGKLHLP